MLWMLREDGPIEDLTAAFLFVGGLTSLRLALALRTREERPFVSWFYMTFALGVLLVAMEEIAWGQRLLGLQTPEWIRSINAQGETTLHNVGALQGKSEGMRLLFGAGGLLGVGLSVRPTFGRIGAPVLLLPWFLLITGHAAIDTYNDFFPIQEQFDLAMQRTSEMVELMIGIAALLFALLNYRRLVSKANPVGIAETQ